MFKNHSVLITGPTSGIGRDLAEQFAEEGAHLILVSRNKTKLDAVKQDLEKRHPIQITTILADLSQTGSAKELISHVKMSGLSVDVLVNNAGYGVYGKFIDEDIASQTGMIELHITAPTELIHAFLPQMIRNRKGGILNVASTGAFQPVPRENVYCATKSYTVHFTEALAEEVKNSGVRVCCLCPGPTETPFFDNPLMKTRTPAKISRMSSSDVARIGFDAFKKGQVLVIPGLRNKIIALAVRLAPRSAVRKVAGKIIERAFPPTPK